MDFGFPAVLALLFLQNNQMFLKQWLKVCFVHELGHGLAMCLTGAGIREIRLYAAGIQLKTNNCLFTVGQTLWIYVSGPLMNLLFAYLLREIQPLDAVLHLGMGLFNLLPYQMLDGGTALQCIFGMRQQVLEFRRIFCIILSMILLSLLYWNRIENPTLYMMLIYLAFSEILVDKSRPLW